MKSFRIALVIALVFAIAFIAGYRAREFLPTRICAPALKVT